MSATLVGPVDVLSIEGARPGRCAAMIAGRVGCSGTAMYPPPGWTGQARTRCDGWQPHDLIVSSEPTSRTPPIELTPADQRALEREYIDEAGVDALPPIHECKEPACRQRIRFALVDAGTRMPIDLEPRRDGNLVWIDPTTVHVLTVDEKRHDTRTRYVSHFATCPARDQFRSRAS